MNYDGATPAIAAGLKVLKERIAAAKIPSSKLDETINVATWNVREFGKAARSKAALYYIAEILSQFDLIAISELRNNLSDLSKVVEIMGPYWRVIFCDAIADSGGNDERIGYLYDNRAATFTGLAAEADPPRVKDNATGQYRSVFEWYRRPFICSFRAGRFDFVLVTAHIQWGTPKGRLKELEGFAAWIDTFRKDKHVFDKDIIVMGDFNVPDLTDKMFTALASTGLQVPKALAKRPGTNLAKVNFYDQILYAPGTVDLFTDKGGVLDFFAGDHKPLFPDLDQEKFTFQVSDHLPLWIQIATDKSDAKLDQIISRK
jgi:endonuclease/exonuclease/phosphatase family metal-dependent hydrolase